MMTETTQEIRERAGLPEGDLVEGTAEYERVWGVLAVRVGSLDGWQYLGITVSPWGDSQTFRLRAGMPRNPYTGNWIEQIKVAA